MTGAQWIRAGGIALVVLALIVASEPSTPALMMAMGVSAIGLAACLASAEMESK